MLEKVPPLGDSWLVVLVTWQQIGAKIEELLQMDFTTINSHAHCF
jgi:hypothetical protein